jgi:hypothetical protein
VKYSAGLRVNLLSRTVSGIVGSKRVVGHRQCRRDGELRATQDLLFAHPDDGIHFHHD